MVKKICLMISLCLSLSLCVFADTYLVDDADLFTNDVKIEKELKSISEKYDIPVYLVTTDKEFDMDALSATDYLLADRVGFNNNGMMMSINMASRDITFTTSGKDLDAKTISDSKIIEIRKTAGNYLSNGNYDEAANYYCKAVSDVLRGNYLSLFDALIAFGASLFGVGSYGVYQKKKYNPKPKRKEFLVVQNAVCDFKINADQFVSERTVVTVKPKTTTSSSSTSHTTGGGSFRGSSGKF